MELLRPEPEDFLCDESFQRFCGGDGTAALFWKDWVKKNPEYADTVKDAMRLYDMLNAGQGNVAEQLDAIKDAIARRERFEDMLARGGEARIVKTGGRQWIRYVAAAAVLAGMVATAFIWTGKKNGTALLAYDHYTSGNSRKTVVLPDSSVIMLNANSHLSISRNFDSEHREVTITGEAFFDIRHDEQHPFVVHTHDYRIRVLGTSFNVTSYPGGQRTETDLISGKVEIVAHAGERVILQPHEKYVLEHRPVDHALPDAPLAPVMRGSVVKMKLDTITKHAVETAWARRKMEIADETFEQIAMKLQAWYGIKVIITSEAVKQYRYTATFNDETIFKALQYLQQSYPFNYRVVDDAIVISRS